MSYPSMIQIRHSTVLVIVVALMGSVLYEVTKTESFPRSRAAARTQDIALAATQPQAVQRLVEQKHDYIGGGSRAVANVKPLRDDGEGVVPAGAARASAFNGAAAGAQAAGGSRFAVTFGSNRGIQSRSSGGGGFSGGSVGMGGAGAWGGASGQARPAAAAAAARGPRAERPARPAQTPRSSNANVRAGSGINNGGGATSAVGWNQLEQTGGFTTGAAAVQSGAVAAVAPAAAAQSPGAAPAATPEPMSMLLVASGLLGVYGVRRRFQ